MAKEYKRYQQPSRKGGGFGQLLLLFCSFFLGYLTASVFDFNSLSSWFKQYSSAKNEHPVRVVAKPREHPKPKLEFYTLLTKDQASIPAPSKPSVAPTQTIVPPPAIAVAPTRAGGVYIVQVAAFNKQKDALQLKAAMLLKGYEVTISTIQNQTTTWYRVMLGPYKTKDEAQKVQVSIANTQRMRGMIKQLNA